MRKSLSSRYPFLLLLLNKKNKNEHTEYHGKTIPIKSQAYSNMGVSLFSCLGYGGFGRGKFFFENLNLSNLGDIQRYHENGK